MFVSISHTATRDTGPTPAARPPPKKLLDLSTPPPPFPTRRPTQSPLCPLNTTIPPPPKVHHLSSLYAHLTAMPGSPPVLRLPTPPSPPPALLVFLPPPHSSFPRRFRVFRRCPLDLLRTHQ